ncbi:MAG: 3-methyl-2-oxobutanoate hydroxymethyltransferase [Elusimicrobia bacterium]|nr:3-methyl-2-oxobutanoate hydroxymethyltransferase [Elusimicrobiota bacterium]
MEPVTTTALRRMKERAEKIAVLTCYDATTARLLSEAGVEILLVGDSLGMVKLGYPTTLPVTVEDILRHTQAVSRGNTRALVVADMPFLSFQLSVSEAMRNCGRMLKEGGAAAVKLEGGHGILETVEALVAAGIPVMGHLGMTPQSLHVFGGYKVQGRSSAAARRIVADAKALERAGAFSLVLECIPPQLAKQVTRELAIPTIGIGAGPFCDGQVLVVDDLLGLHTGVSPKFVKQYAHLAPQISQAVRAYVRDVKTSRFPTAAHSY